MFFGDAGQVTVCSACVKCSFFLVKVCVKQHVMLSSGLAGPASVFVRQIKCFLEGVSPQRVRIVTVSVQTGRGRRHGEKLFY